VALADCNEALRIAPENYYVLASRCFVRFRTGDFANAVADCDAALKLKSDLPSALYIRGLAETRLGYADMGKADLAAAAALDPKTADTYAGYGVKP
jgi:tetratricopeptide (TPR) repeat protein